MALRRVGQGLEEDDCSSEDHSQGYPLDGVEDIGERAWVGIESVSGMPEERDEELRDA